MAKQIATNNRDGEFSQNAQNQRQAFAKLAYEGNAEKIATSKTPTCVIHGRKDQVVLEKEAAD